MNPLANTGRIAPLGATIVDGGVNFSVFSHNATGVVELLLFDREDDAQPARVIRIDPSGNRTCHYWHVFVPGVHAGQNYGIAFSAEMRHENLQIHLILNAYWEPLDFELPPVNNGQKVRADDGSAPPSIRRTTSSNGNNRRRLRGTPTALSHDPS